MSSESAANQVIARTPIQHEQWTSLVRLRLADGVTLTNTTENKWTLTDGAAQRSFSVLGTELPHFFIQLGREGVPLNEVIASVGQSATALSVAEQVDRLWRYGVLVQELQTDGKVGAAFTGRGKTPLCPVVLDVDQPLFLTDELYFRTESHRLIIETLRFGARLTLSDPPLFRIPILFLRGFSPSNVARKMGCSIEWVMAIASWLSGMGCGVDRTCEPSKPTELTGWAFADKLLHARSRGRHIDHYGAAFPLRDVIPAPPALRPNRQTHFIELPRPDVEASAKKDPPFGVVLESRRSLRRHNVTPITLTQLSEFLFRCARVKERFAGGGLEYTKRPYPSGGGLYEIDLYPLVVRCDGLEPSLYRYDGLEHRLEFVSSPSPNTEELLQMAIMATGIDSRPDVLIILAARFHRVFWKYESMAYALVLKNVGVIYQTMYLVATAMGLAPTAIGGGNADAFCRAAGTSFWEETSVGEFILGRPCSEDSSQPPVMGHASRSRP